ncbi:MAG: glycosyltransferase family 39 protein [Chloroflexota bacterium]
MNFNWIDKRPFYQWVLLILLIALCLRLPNIGRDSLWLDESISYLASQLPVQQIFNNSVQSSHPPMYYFFLKLWGTAVPDSDSTLRGLGVLWSLLLIPLIAQFSKDLFRNKKLALLTALLVAISPFHILYSHELRMYTQVMFFVTLGTWAYWQARHSSDWRWWLLFGIGFGTAVYTHLFANLALFAVNLHALLETDRRKIFPTVFGISVGLAILFLPWGLSIFAESEQELGSLRPLNQEYFRNPIKPLTSIAFLLFGISSSFAISGTAFFIALSFILILLLEVRRLHQEGVPSGVKLILLQIGFVLGVPLVVYTIRPFFLPERTMAAASPALLLLLTWVVTRNKSPLPYLTAVSALLMFVSTASYHFGDPLKPPYQEATTYVVDSLQANDLVLHTSDGSYLPALRYAELPNHLLLAGDPDPRKPIEVYELVGGDVVAAEEVLDRNGRLWVIVALEHSLEWQQAQSDFFAAQFRLLESQNIGGIDIFLYEDAGN